MEKYFKYRRFYQLTNCIRGLASKYLIRTLIIFAIYIIGLILGAVIMSQLVAELSVDNITDASFYAFLNRDIEWISLFFSYFVSYLLLYLFTIFINRNLFFTIINIIILLCFGFNLGYNFVLYLTIFNVIAIIFIIIIVPIFNLAIMFLYSFLLAVVWHRNSDCKKFGKFCNNCIFKHCYIAVAVIVLLMLFVYCFLLNIFRIFIVIS